MRRLLEDIREIVREQAQYTELLIQVTRRDMLLRYKQAAMGVGWALFMPLVNTAVFSVIFMRVAQVETDLPYPLFAYCGLLTWNFSAASFRSALNSLTSNVNLVTKVYFPREILPLSSICVALLDLAVGSTVLVALAIYYRVPPSWTICALPLVLAVHIVFTAAVALLLAMANLFYRDVKYLFDVAIMVWMFATSVVYPVNAVGGRLGLLLAANPMTAIIDAYRTVLFQGELPGPAFAVTAAASVAFIVVAAVLFHRAEYQFAENI